jgi:hypothetical protein
MNFSPKWVFLLRIYRNYELFYAPLPTSCSCIKPGLPHFMGYTSVEGIPDPPFG